MDLLEKSYEWLILDHVDEYQWIIRRLTKIIERGRGNTHAFNNRGAALFEIGQIDDARRDYHAAIRQSPSNAVPWVNLARLDEGIGDLQAAIADYDRAISIDAGDPSFWRGRGELHLQRHNAGDAIADFTSAIELDPGFKVTFLQRADAYGVLGRHDLAEQDRNTGGGG